MLFRLILKNRDLLKAMQPEGSWVMPEALVVSDLAICLHLTFSDLLQNNIHTYATAFILSPGLSSYRGKVANRLLVSAVFCCWVSLKAFQIALRELNVTLLPPEKEPAQVKEVLSCISKYLTTTCNSIKTQVRLVFQFNLETIVMSPAPAETIYRRVR